MTQKGTRLVDRMPTLVELQPRIKVHANGCWEYLRKDGSSHAPSTVPMVGPQGAQEQVARVVLRLVGREVPEGHTISRRLFCLRFCCNPQHLTVVEKARWRPGDRKSRNPLGRAAAPGPQRRSEA